MAVDPIRSDQHPGKEERRASQEDPIPEAQVTIIAYPIAHNNKRQRQKKLYTSILPFQPFFFSPNICGRTLPGVKFQNSCRKNLRWVVLLELEVVVFSQ